MHRVLSALFVFVLLFGMVGPEAAVAAPAAGSIALTTSTYTQDFNTLVSTGTSSTTPNGWTFNETGSSANTTYSAGDGSSTTGDTYSFGASGNSERAFGSLLSSNLKPTIGAAFTNNTGGVVAALNIAFNCEQWRIGVANRNAADRMDFQYSLDATSLTTGNWTAVTGLNCLSTVINGTAGSLNGNTSRTAVSGSITGLNIATGASFWLRWTDYDISSSDDGLGIDDFSLTATLAVGPSITTQPQSQTITSGSTASLSVVASGSTPLSYQWYQGTSGNTGSPISDATSATYTTPTLTATTSYWVRVTNSVGSVDSNTATITVTVVAPSITTQPQSQTITSGSTATLSVAASGTAPFGYQWYQGSSGDTSAPISGATGSSYTTPTLTATTSYWVRVSNSGGSTDSNTATVTVQQVVIAPGITTQPQSQTITSGSTAALNVVASGTTPLSYQWYQGNSGDTSTPVGTNADTFTTPALTTTTSYWVRVSNSAGSADSDTATVTVTIVPPGIDTQPQSQTITSGSTASLSVVATGTAPLSYQWYQGSASDTSTPVGTNSANFTTPALTSTTSYWVRVSNSAGSADSNTATVTVTVVAPAITTQPQSQTITSGSTASLSVAATGTAPLTYQWYQGSASDTSTPVGTNSANFTTPALTSTTSYWVRVSNSAGSADSSTATITVSAASPKVVISQFQVAGGTAADEFIELHNIGASSIDLQGYTLVYRSAAGTSDVVLAQWTTATPLAPGQFYLVAATPGYDGVVSADKTFADGGSGKLSGSSGGLALRNGAADTGTIVDSVGYGGATNAFVETATTTAPATNASQARKGSGCQDTNNNSNDFATVNPSAPRNSATTAVACSGDIAPTVSSTSPANGATNVVPGADVSIAFSEPVTVSGAWYAISCGTSGSHTAVVSGGPTTYTLNPDVDFTAGESCTVAVYAAQVVDQDGTPTQMAADYSFSFTIASSDPCTAAADFIHTIQGPGATSPVSGQTKTIMGYVVGDFETGMKGYYVEEEPSDWDANSATSEGIFVYDNNTTSEVNVGDKVRVTGTVSEYDDRTAGGGTVTELTSPSAPTVCSTGNTVTPVDITLPETTNGDLEHYEGMLVRVTTTMTIVDNYYLGRYGQMGLSGDGRLYLPTNQYPKNSAEALALADHNARAFLVLDDGVIDTRCGNNPNPVPYLGPPPLKVIRSGDTVTNLTGVIDYGQIDSTANGDSCTTGTATFGGDYRLQPTVAPTFVAENPRPSAPTTTADVKVVGANLLNWFNGDGNKGGFPTSRGATNFTEFVRQRIKLYEELSQLNADIVTLMELENDGFGSSSAIAELVTVLNSGPCWNSPTECANLGYSSSGMGTGTYAYVNLGLSAVGTDQITVGMIYKPARVEIMGTPAVLTDAGYTDPNGTGSQKSRPALAVSFRTKTSSQATYTVVANHLKSKGSCPTGTGPDADQGNGQGCWNDTRTKGAQYLVNTWLPTNPTGIVDPDFLLMGDMNAYAHEDPILAFEAAGYTDLINKYVGSSGYSYAFDGQFGYLDHALASPNLAAQAVSAAEWHNNSDEPPVIDYDTEYNQANGYYTPNAYRASDHDPVLVGFTSTPLAVDLASFTATPSSGAIELAWETTAEQNNAGFNVQRAESLAGPWTAVNPTLIAAAAPGTTGGHSYTWTDATAAAGISYWYRLESVDLSGARQLSDPVSATLTGPTAVSLRGLHATAAPAVWPLALLLAGFAFFLLSRKRA